MVNACADPDFFVRRGGGGGVGGGWVVQAQRRENSLDFFYVCFGVFWSKKFRGCVQLFTREGVQMLISIEFDRTCDLPGMGSGPLTPPPPSSSGSAHA